MDQETYSPNHAKDKCMGTEKTHAERNFARTGWQEKETEGKLEGKKREILKSRNSAISAAAISAWKTFSLSSRKDVLEKTEIQFSMGIEETEGQTDK